MAIDITGKYDEARKLIDVTLSASILPDSVIEMDVYAGQAVTFVNLRTGNDDIFATRAAVYKLASLLCKAVPDILSQSNAGFSWQKGKTDLDAKSLELENESLRLIDASEQANPTDVGQSWDEPMPGFDVASSSRCSDIYIL